jgi:hypothetical protein
LGRYDDALGHLRDAYDLGDGFDSAWLAAWSRVQLATLDMVQGRKDEARDLLDEALALGLAAHSTGCVTLCLVAFARYAVMEGDAERAALLPGRQRACGTGLACERGRCCGTRRTTSWPRSAGRWARDGSTRCTPPAPGSASGTRSPLSGTGPAPAMPLRRHGPAHRPGHSERRMRAAPVRAADQAVKARTGAPDGYTGPFGILMVYSRTDRGACPGSASG